MRTPVTFHFDFASPYAYLAAQGVDALAERHERSVIYRPILLGAVFKVTGSQPNVARPLQGDYLRHDVPRFARLLGVPLVWPASAPIAAIAASRAFYWLDTQDPVAAARLARGLFHAHWGQGRDIAGAEAVADVAAELGLDRAAVLAGTQDPAAKERLRATTDTAIAAGVFGSPFFLVDGEGFWGADRMDQLERWLATGGW